MNRLVTCALALLALSCTRNNDRLWLDADIPLTGTPAYEYRILNHWDNLDDTIERGYAGPSIFEWTSAEVPEGRIREYGLLNQKIGINGTVLNNVNASPKVLDREHLERVAAIADILRDYGIRVYLSVNFASPMALGGLPTADPLDPSVIAWWNAKVEEIYSLVPDFGGFLVKASSEGQPGPQDFGRSHTDGANCLADALAPHGGIVMWRAFVYAANSPDRAMQAVQEFEPLDGQFRDNVSVQIKNGPVDFQPREPFSPLFGRLHKTSMTPELQITMEYLGQASSLVFLAPMWEECLGADTFRDGPGSTVAAVTAASPLSAIAGVANIGRDENWCGNIFNQANWYAFGRLAWDPTLTSEQIADEWLRITFPRPFLMSRKRYEKKFLEPMKAVMLASREACVDYMMPLGLHHIFAGEHHFGPEPWYAPEGIRQDWTPAYYHKAAPDGIGFDRTVASGSGATAQYNEPLAAEYESAETCPEELLLWFHHLPWEYRMRSGRTLWSELCSHYYSGVEAVRGFCEVWADMKPYVSRKHFEEVSTLLETNLRDAQWWRDACLGYFSQFSGKSYATASSLGNPYLPLWEHVPDGEPHVFEDPDNAGHYRVYVYGSHDTRVTSYCGQDVRCWSAPVEDLASWRDEGPVFSYKAGDSWDLIYAPDIMEVTRRDTGERKYYLFPHSRGWRREGMVCEGDRPDGPFTPINLAPGGLTLLPGSVIDFDPGALVETVDDPSDPDYPIGYRAYVAWGFKRSSATQLDPLEPYKPRYGSSDCPDFVNDEEFHFYEASSFRKVGNKYVYIYSGHSGPDYGMSLSNATLRYAYSDNPLGPWKSGGVLVDARAPQLSRDGSALVPGFGANNTHGSLVEIGGQWYVFYHRAPRGFGYARQAMVSPVSVQADEKPVSEGGEVRITAYDPYRGGFTLKTTGGDEYKGAEVTSEGFHIYGLPPFRYYSAGYACVLSDHSLMKDGYDIWDNRMDVAGVRSGDYAGFKYFDVRGLTTSSEFNLFLAARTESAFKVNVVLDEPWGEKIGEITVPEGSGADITCYKAALGKRLGSGKRALYLVAEGPSGEVLCDFIGLGFTEKGGSLEFTEPPKVTFKYDGALLDTPAVPEWATGENGYTDCTNYRMPQGLDFSKVSAESDSPEVIIVRHPALRQVRCTYRGLTKTFRF